MERKANSIKMIIFFFLIFLVLFIAVTGRFLYIQAKGEVNDVSLENWAADQRKVNYPLKAERGKIYDNAGVMLAYDRPVFRIYAVVDSSYSQYKNEILHVDDPAETAKKLAKYLDIDEKSVEEKLTKVLQKNEKLPEDERQFQIEFGSKGKNISQTTKNEIDKENIPGIYFMEDSTRYYPNGTFASHIIGFARPDEKTKDNKINGIVGMEKVKNEILEGKDGHISFERDKFNKKPLKSKEIISEPENGKDIYLTIDQKIQTLLEDVLSNVVEVYEPERVTATIMNPKTGEIIAMSNRPSYNPNQPEKVDNWYNDVISTPVEPGSTVKMFTWAAAIESGVYDGTETFESGSYRIDGQGRAINDHNQGRGWGKITYDEGFRRSSNVATAKLVWEKLTPDNYMTYLKAFDFNKKTEIDLPSESKGTIMFNYPIEKVTTGFGQGSTMTPIQQLKAATAIANNGKMMKPYVIKKIVNPTTEKIIEENEPSTVGEPISKETANHVLKLLGDVVNGEGGTGKAFQINDYSVAGKTGTAQIPDPEGGGYLKGKENYLFSFLGMAPKDNPELMMHVSVTQPKLADNQVGSDVTSLIFTRVMSNSLKYLNIEPDKTDEGEIETIKMPNVIDKETKEVENKLKQLNINYKLIGDGDKIIASTVSESTKLLRNNTVMLITNQPTMPDLTGWSKREVLEFGQILDIPIEVKGDGFVTKQNIKESEKITKQTKLEIEFSKPF
ncbi:MAG TPA: penicillin-binding protein [Pseudogracilibacillus sp.]|nr:penicillin-binding protein [Pseudogracilibacillus sp.]